VTTASWARARRAGGSRRHPTLIRLGGEVGVEQMWIKSSQAGTESRRLRAGMAVVATARLAFDTTAYRQYGKGKQQRADDAEYNPVSSTFFRKLRFRSAYDCRSCTGREHPIVYGG
jgi:hypothetical protein